MRRSCSLRASSIIWLPLLLLHPLALQRIAGLLPLLQATCVMQQVGIAVALQELAEGSTRDTGLVGTVHHNLVFFVERGECLPQRGEVDRTRNALGLERPLTQSHHQAEVLLAVQLLLQLLAANCSHHILLSGSRPMTATIIITVYWITVVMSSTVWRMVVPVCQGQSPEPTRRDE